MSCLLFLAQKNPRIPRFLSAVTGLAAPTSSLGATKTLSTPSRGAMYAMFLPSGLIAGSVRVGLPKMSLRGISRSCSAACTGSARGNRAAMGAAPAPLKTIHPLGKAPAIRDGDVVLAESGAIVDYIVHRRAQGRLALRPDDPAYARYIYWLHFAEGSLMSLLLIVLVLSRVREAAASPVSARMRERMNQMLSFVDKELGSGPWFAGAEFTAADIMM